MAVVEELVIASVYSIPSLFNGLVVALLFETGSLGQGTIKTGEVVGEDGEVEAEAVVR